MRILDESEIEKTFVERDPVLPVTRPAPSPARPLIGQTRIGFGLVVDTIGAGGMASVYKVWNERLELFRAVKMLSLDTLHARFETEAKITAKLRHPHIVEVYSVGEWNGVPYMEMEYVDGVNMQEALEAHGRFPDAVCCAAGLCIASALNYAHTLKFTLGGNSYDGIIHRDLKPANILISKHSEIKLTDFGIARPAQVGLHTIDGNIVGTLYYLSPEQLVGGTIDQRSDIYSFGTILYEMATGTKTFPQKSITELTMHRAANSFKSPSEYETPVPPAISNIILKCLKTSARERYKCAAELITDLRKAYAETAKGNAPQKTLYDFFSEDAVNAGATPTLPINVDVDTNVDIGADTDVNIADGTNGAYDADENTDDVIDTNVNDIDTVDTDGIDTYVNTTANTTFAKRPFEFPLTKRTTIYATAMLILLLSTFCVAIKLMSRRQSKMNDTQASVTANFFSPPADTATAAVNASPSANNSNPQKNVNAANTDTIDVNTTNIDTARVTAARANTTSADTTIAAAVVNTVDINTKTVPPSAPAPINESALIKSAAEAMDRKEWDRAIGVLARNGAAFKEKHGERHLLLLEAYVESRQLDKARSVIDSAAKTNDALYFLTAGRYMFYRNDHAGALTALEASLTRSSALRNRSAILGDALYYIALIRSARFKASPTETTRKQAQDAWRRVKSTYESKPESPQFKRAETEILELY